MNSKYALIIRSERSASGGACKRYIHCFNKRGLKIKQAVSAFIGAVRRLSPFVFLSSPAPTPSAVPTPSPRLPKAAVRISRRPRSGLNPSATTRLPIVSAKRRCVFRSVPRRLQASSLRSKRRQRAHRRHGCITWPRRRNMATTRRGVKGDGNMLSCSVKADRVTAPKCGVAITDAGWRQQHV